jgi:hypothetical protein
MFKGRARERPGQNPPKHGCINDFRQRAEPFGPRRAVRSHRPAARRLPRWQAGKRGQIYFSRLTRRQNARRMEEK